MTDGQGVLRRSIILVAFCMAAVVLRAWSGQNPPSGRPSTNLRMTGQQVPAATPPAALSSSSDPLPGELILHSGTLITVRLSQSLSSNRDQPGDPFSAELQQPLVVHGWVVARRGQTVLGRVAFVQKAGRVKGVARLGLELNQLVMVDGQQSQVWTHVLRYLGSTSRGRDAEAAGATTGVGAIIGAASAGGEGAGIGAGLGGAAGVIGVLLTRGRPVVIPSETLLTFRLASPVTISTQKSRAAFRSVTQEDYTGGTMGRRPQRAAPRPSLLDDWGYDPWGPWGYGYPGPLFGGFYGFGMGYGWGGFRH